MPALVVLRHTCHLGGVKSWILHVLGCYKKIHRWRFLMFNAAIHGCVSCL